MTVAEYDPWASLELHRLSYKHSIDVAQGRRTWSKGQQTCMVKEINVNINEQSIFEDTLGVNKYSKTLRADKHVMVSIFT